VSPVRSIRWFSLVLVLAPACVTSPEEQAGAEPDSELAQEEPAAVADVTPAEPAAAEPSPRTLAELQLELANNNAKLQALGVQLPPHDLAGGDATPGERKAEPERPPDSAGRGVGGGGNGGSSPAKLDDDARPSPSPAPTTRSDKGAGKTKEPRKPKKTESSAVGSGFAPAPEGAKSTPLSPSEQPQLDAATRCSQVCSLSDISCELGVQICELAQRHVENQDYEQACVRATEDCDAAQEACDACTQ
jgi:hypothetical protein